MQKRDTAKREKRMNKKTKQKINEHFEKPVTELHMNEIYIMDVVCPAATAASAMTVTTAERPRKQQ